MKKFVSLAFVLVLSPWLQNSWAQAPQSFKYQSVARNSNGDPISSEAIGLRISIHDLTETGVIVYRESHTATTNDFGLFTVSVGTGAVTIGNFSAIAWGIGAKFIEIEADFAGGASYTSMGTSQLLSVPYALYSENGTPGPQGQTGATGAQGVAGPAGPQGLTGLNGATGSAGAQGIQGIQGITGTNGTDGLNVLSGTTNPSAGTGSTGAYNSAFGNVALLKNTIGSYNTAFGSEALRENTTGNYNSAIGTAALWLNTTGNGNAASGYEALKNNTSGKYNTA